MAQGYVYNRVDQIERANISESDDYHESHLDTPGKASTQHPAFFNYLFVIFLIVTSFCTGYYISPIASKPKTKAGQIVDHKDTLRESTRDFLPPLPNRIERFVLNESFHQSPSEDVTAAWTALIPKGQGAINLPITNEYNNNVYNIAVFHSLHCLVLFSHAKTDGVPVHPPAIFLRFSPMATASISIDRPAYEIAYMRKHGSHCIEYIRQQLMCNPDLTLEPIDLETGSPKDWGVERLCVDWEGLVDWAVRERLNDEVGIV